jgi:hypothetical protein
MSDFYVEHPDYGGEIDHGELIDRLLSEYDGFCLHTASVTLDVVLASFPGPLRDLDCRVCAWVKPFASFKKNVTLAYAWEPVIIRPARKAVVSHRTVSRDWIAVPITMQRGLVGAKPDGVCRWLFEVIGAHPDDSLDDLYPGTGAVARAWEAWRQQPSLFDTEVNA